MICSTDTNEIEEELEKDISVITHGKAAEMLDQCLQWYEQQDQLLLALFFSLNEFKT